MSLTITGLNSAGQRVVVEEFFDLDDSATITAADLLVQRVKVTDGAVTNIAGQRNLNVPGDEDGAANSSILTRFVYSPVEITRRLDGRHIFRISPDDAGFTPFTGNLTVTQQDYAGSGISGRVINGDTPVGGAVVLISQGDFEVKYVTKTNAAGNYSIKLPAGTYSPVAAKAGLTGNAGSAPQVTVNAGVMTSGPDATVAAATRTISGQVRDDAVPAVPLGGLLVYGIGPGGRFGMTFTDGSGNYTLPAVPGATETGIAEEEVALHGVLHLELPSESSTTSVTGFDFTLPRATAMIYGTLKTPANVPLAFKAVEANSEGEAQQRRGAGTTDATGHFTIAVTAGNWRVRPEADGFLIPELDVIVPAAATAVQLNISAAPVTAHLRGQVLDDSSQPVINTELFATDNAGVDSNAVTDATGHFDIPVFGGSGGTAKTWSLQLNLGGDSPAEFLGGNMELQVTDGTDINGIVYHVLGVTAHLHGNLRLDGGDPPPGIYQVYASAQNFSANSNSDTGTGGAFDLPVLAGVWQLGLSGQPSGVIGQDNFNVTVTGNVDQNGLVFHLRTASRAINGTVRNGSGTGLGGLEVHATITDAGTKFTSTSFTSPDGTFSLPSFPGLWTVGLSSSYLNNQGYAPAANQTTNTTAGNTSMLFTVTEGGGGGADFNDWLTNFFTPAQRFDQSISGPNADPDHDNISNLMEFALALNPTLRDTSGLPAVGTIWGAGGPFITLEFSRVKDADQLVFNVQEASDPAGPWTTVSAGFEILFQNSAIETVRAKAPVGSDGRHFLRLEVVKIR